jgi:hypothetical protein
MDKETRKGGSQENDLLISWLPYQSFRAIRFFRAFAMKDVDVPSVSPCRVFSVVPQHTEV